MTIARIAGLVGLVAAAGLVWVIGPAEIRRRSAYWW
jgi:hypothetical protein